MSFTTRYPGEIVIAQSAQNIVFGTVMLGDVFGKVESASVTREADIAEVEGAGGNLLAVILRNPKFSFKFKVLFSADVTAPGLADVISFPFAGISGRVMPPITVEWEKAAHRMLSIEATSWDSFGGTGAGNLVTLN